MRLPILLIVIALFVRCQPSKSQPQHALDHLPQIAGPLLIQDLELFKTEMERYHPGLLWYQSSSEWEELIDLARKEISQGTDLISFYWVLSRINANIGCGHTSVRLGRDYRDTWMDSANVFPVNVKVLDQKLIVSKPIIESGAVPLGSEILSINGFSSDDIIDRMAATMSMDGFNKTGKYHRMARGFSFRLLHFIDPLATSFEVVYRPPAGESNQTVQVTGIDAESYEQQAQNETPLLEFHRHPELSDTYYMRIKTFSSNWMRSEGFKYFDFLKKSFKELKEANADNLILDLRGNGGGDDGNGSKLMSYLVDQSFGYYRSIEVKPDYDGWGSPVQTEDGRYLITGHNDLAWHRPNDNNFDGQLYVLIDGGSFSATSEFAALIHDRNRAIFIGMETGGGYYGNSSGNRRRLTLTNTELEVSIPYWKYLVDIDGNDYYGKGVAPTHEIEQSVADLLEDRDTALEFTLDLIEKTN